MAIAMKNSSGHDKKGVGVAFGIYGSAWSAPTPPGRRRLNPDGTVSVFNTWLDTARAPTPARGLRP